MDRTTAGDTTDESPDGPDLGVTEIATRVGLHKSTVSRPLAALEQDGLVERDPGLEAGSGWASA